MGRPSSNLLEFRSRNSALAGVVATPTDDLAIACDTTGKIIARLDLDKGIGGWSALAKVVFAPTNHSSVRAKST
jgi:hypothetical protein